MKRVEFLATARAELRETVDWYDAQRPGLGDEFIQSLVQCLSFMRSFPNASPRVSRLSRRCRLRRFPYGLIYQVREDRLLIVAVMHLHRRPGYWRDRETEH